jgi:molybdopterin converting factor subunit 1
VQALAPLSLRLLMTSSKQITVQYFALFREQRGMSSETVATSARNARELYAELQKAHGFSLPVERVQVAVNDDFAEWDAELNAGSTVVFIPPVAGG